MPGGGRRTVRQETALDHPYLTVRLDTERDEQGREHTYIVGGGPDVAFVVALWPDGDVTLNRQRRYGEDEPCLEVPGGHVESDETPAAGARRELREETGIRAARMTPLLSCLLSAKIRQRLHFFLAEDLSAGAPERDADEEIELVRLPLAEAVALVHAGEVQHGPSVTALLLAAAAAAARAG